jgi:D-alanyl-D-alanine carboxypeptidase
MLARAVVFVLLSSAALQTARAQAWTPEKQALADQRVRAIAGPAAQRIVYGVAVNGEPAHVQGFAGVRGALPPNGATKFRIGSLTKQFTAAAVLALIEDSKSVRRAPPLPGFPVLQTSDVSLDTRIDRFIPGAKAWPNSGPVTVRHLLNMQTGFANYTTLPAGITKSATAQVSADDLATQIGAMISAQSALTPPGTGYGYTNTNYFLLARILDKASPAKDYRTYVRDRVFARAGMSKTVFITDPDAMQNLATPPANKINGAFGKAEWPRGAGDIVSTVDDQLAWHKALMSFKVIGPQSGASMFTGVAPAGNFSPTLPQFYAMGWFSVPLPGNRIYSYHSGSIAGYSAYAGILTDFNTGKWASVVLFANDDGVGLP